MMSEVAYTCPVDPKDPKQDNVHSIPRFAGGHLDVHAHICTAPSPCPENPLSYKGHMTHS